MKIRSIEADDIDGMLTIENASFNNKTRQKRKDLLKTIGSQGHVGFIALNDSDRPLGYVLGSPLERYKYADDPGKGMKDTIYCESIAVMPNDRGKGIGKALYKNFLLEAMRKGYKRETEHAYKGEMGFRSSVVSEPLEYLKEWYEDGSDALYTQKPLGQNRGTIADFY